MTPDTNTLAIIGYSLAGLALLIILLALRRDSVKKPHPSS